mgnify:CR=1 FL=1
MCMRLLGSGFNGLILVAIPRRATINVTVWLVLRTSIQMEIHAMARRFAHAFLLLGLIVGCGGPPPDTRWQAAQTQKGPAVSTESVAGGAFNKFFPKTEGEFDLVYSQEKTGFAQAKLNKAGKEVAILSVFDTVNNPEAREKFKSTAEVFEGYPIAEIGSQGTAVLVADRFQVQVRSSDPGFTKFDREDWLKKFDLAGIGQLK